MIKFKVKIEFKIKIVQAEIEEIKVSCWKISLNENELKELISNIRTFEVAKGGYEKKIRESERKVMAKLTKSIVSSTNIKKDDVITRNMLTPSRLWAV